jgi:molybdopterin/thiamine biosynthesis adenylyltransferase
MHIINCNPSNHRPSSKENFALAYDPEACHRHMLAFGEETQKLVSSLTIGIVGLGGLGMIILELVMRLFPAKIIAADFDPVSQSNLNRLVGASFEDAKSRILKTELASRHIKTSNPSQSTHMIKGNFLDREVQDEFKICDFIFTTCDRVGPRLAANQLSLAHGIINLDTATGATVSEDGLSSAGGQILILKPDSGFCLACAEIYDIKEAAQDLISTEELKRQSEMGYIKGADIPRPQVYALNMMVASWAVWIFQRLTAGEELDFDGLAVDAKNFQVYTWTERRKNPNNCLICGQHGIVFAGDNFEPLVREKNPIETGLLELKRVKPSNM